MIFQSKRSSLFAAFEKIDVTFRLNEEYHFSYFFNQGLMHNICTRPKSNVLYIQSYEPSKMWNLTSEMVFTKYGMINIQTFVQDKLTATKYYTKVLKYDNRPNNSHLHEANYAEVPAAKKMTSNNSTVKSLDVPPTTEGPPATVPVSMDHPWHIYSGSLWDDLAKGLEKLKVTPNKWDRDKKFLQETLDWLKKSINHQKIGQQNETLDVN